MFALRVPAPCPIALPFDLCAETCSDLKVTLRPRTASRCTSWYRARPLWTTALACIDRPDADRAARSPCDGNRPGAQRLEPELIDRDGEIAEYRFVAPSEIERLTIPRLARRLLTTLNLQADGRSSAYLEDGMAHEALREI
jgi:hypothetical protein